MMAESTKSVLALKIPTTPETESHTFEFQIPTRTELNKYLTSKKKRFIEMFLKLPTGHFEKVDHTVYFFISANEGIGVEFQFKRLPSLTLIMATYELHFISNGIPKVNSKGHLILEVNDVNFEKWNSGWDKLSISSLWNNSINTIQLVLNIELGVEWTRISPSSSTGVGGMQNPTNESFSDVKLICGNRHFSVHRLILCSKSEFFKSMFDQQMKKSPIVIDDIEPDILHEILQYIYTGYAEISPTNALELFKATDKYRLEDLKSDCVTKVTRNVSLDNALEVYLTGCKHESKELIDSALRFLQL